MSARLGGAATGAGPDGSGGVGSGGAAGASPFVVCAQHGLCPTSMRMTPLFACCSHDLGVGDAEEALRRVPDDLRPDGRVAVCAAVERRAGRIAVTDVLRLVRGRVVVTVSDPRWHLADMFCEAVVTPLLPGPEAMPALEPFHAYVQAAVHRNLMESHRATADLVREFEAFLETFGYNRATFFFRPHVDDPRPFLRSLRRIARGRRRLLLEWHRHEGDRREVLTRLFVRMAVPIVSRHLEAWADRTEGGYSMQVGTDGLPLCVETLGEDGTDARHRLAVLVAAAAADAFATSPSRMWCVDPEYEALRAAFTGTPGFRDVRPVSEYHLSRRDNQAELAARLLEELGRRARRRGSLRSRLKAVHDGWAEDLRDRREPDGFP